MKKKDLDKNDDNLQERLENIIEKKSNENSALKNLLEKIYKEIDELHPDQDDQNKES